MASELGGSLEFWVGVSHWLTGIGTIVLAVALIRTFRHLEASTRLSKIEAEYRLRPWIGPSAPITRMDNSISGDIQFSVPIKNFGDLPASNVKGKSIIDIKPLSRDSLKETLSEYNLGPLLPHMEKKYWFFVTPLIWEKISNENETLYVATYFEYPSLNGMNGYGMVSEYNKKNQTFVHKDMWIDFPEVKI